MHEEPQPARVVTPEMAVEAVRPLLPRRRRRMELTLDTDFEQDLGFTSLDVAEVFVRLEELVGQPLDTTQIEETRMIGDLLVVRVAADVAS